MFGGGAEPPLGPDVPPVVEQVGQRVGAQRVPGLGGLPQPVFGAGLVTALPEVPAERVRGGRGPGDGRDPPPAGRLVGVPALVEQQRQIVRGGPVPVLHGLPQKRLRAVEVPAPQQQRAERAHRPRVALLGGPAVPRLDLRFLAQREGVLVGRSVSSAGTATGSAESPCPARGPGSNAATLTAAPRRRPHARPTPPSAHLVHGSDEYSAVLHHPP